jgi:flavin reductase (DIM6/NTAB) family NADH-FMN oxidoreductase RutF/rubredoxin
MNLEAYFKITYGLYVVCSAFDSKRSGYISNTVFQVTAEPPQLAISCSKNNFTCALIEKSLGFSVSALKKEVRAEIIGAFGYKSGRDIDKFTNFKYTNGNTGAPVLLEDSLAWFECEVVQIIDTGSHMLFIGKVVDGDLLEAAGEPLTYAWYREVKKGKAPKNAPTYIDASVLEASRKSSQAVKYQCTACGHIYDPELGDPAAGVPPGTPFEELPDSWTCPVCGAEKSDFVKIA